MQRHEDVIGAQKAGAMGGDLVADAMLWTLKTAYSVGSHNWFPYNGAHCSCDPLSLHQKQAFHHVFEKEGVSCGSSLQEGGPLLRGL